MFADGYADLNPSRFGPMWSILDDSTMISKPVNDKLNKAYSSFIYLHDDFRCLNRNHQVLTTDTTCSDHHDKMLRDRASKSTSTEHVRSLCQALPDCYMSFGANDDHFSKVPRTNAAMRASVSSGNTLQCLTLFKNEDLLIVCNSRERGSECTTINYQEHLSLLQAINDPGYCWLDKYLDIVKTKSGLETHRPLYDTIRLFKHMDTTLPEYVNASIAFLFYADILLNKGTCLVHECGKVPGRGLKSSLLHREFARPSECQYMVTQGLNKTQVTNVFSDCVKPMKHKGDRSLSIKEHRNLFENLEHDRMLASNYDRQSFLFNNSSNYKSDNDNFTHDDNGLIDEIRFVSCSPHTNDGRFHVYNNWSIKFKGMLNELAIGGVCSPCPNLTFFETGKDNLGHAIATYDGIFQNEREKERFYLESIL